ncbi:MAG: cofactor-independent phosphoglycerate mutase [Phycisphaerae bacterium]|nr:cofactor-independent phosphoglycerate mutase [Phycisphaerae bacterium]
MKYAIILPDGAADLPVPELDGRTPLEAARKPNMDWIAASGRQGRVVTVPEGYTPGSDVATLTLFGYDPAKYYSGRAPLEAAAQGLPVGEDELVFRCNLVTIVDGVMADFTAGHIGQKEAERILADLNTLLGGERCRFHVGVSYRNLMIAARASEIDVQCTPPHDIPDKAVDRYLPRGRGAEWLRGLMDQARALLSEHDVNVVRRDLGENPVTDIWLWGQGRPMVLPTLHERFGLRGALIAAVDLIRGIARLAGMDVIDVPGATGYLDTDYAAKGRYAVEALDKYDVVVVHVEAPDEAGHLGNVREKVAAIERVDAHVVGRVLNRLRQEPEWRILVAPDHPTPVSTRVHSAEPPPFCLAGTRFHGIVQRAFCESAASKSDLFIDPGHELLEYFLRGS